MPFQREAHVKRVFRMDSSGNVDTSAWIDVLRIDKLTVTFQSEIDGAVGQAINYYLMWNDDPNSPRNDVDNSAADIQGENANLSSRQTEQINVRDPQNPDNGVGLWIIDKVRLVRGGTQDGIEGQVINMVFDNETEDGSQGGNNNPNTRREGEVIKVINNDLAGMQMADDDGSNPILVDWQTYLQALSNGTTDASQRLDVEVTDHFWVDFGADLAQGTIGQMVQFSLADNQQIEALYDPGNPDAQDTNGNASVVRTDPLQIVVNVGSGGLAVEFLNGAS